MHKSQLLLISKFELFAHVVQLVEEEQLKHFEGQPFFFIIK